MARCDASSFESVRGTGQADSGAFAFLYMIINFQACVTNVLIVNAHITEHCMKVEI